jgi:hypothetical protein
VNPAVDDAVAEAVLDGGRLRYQAMTATDVAVLSELCAAHDRPSQELPESVTAGVPHGPGPGTR